MVKRLLYILCILFLLTSCTGDQIRFLNKSLGLFKVMSVFPIDLSNTEKQVFHTRLEKPVTSDKGWTAYYIELCVDSIPDASLYYTNGWVIQTKVSIDGYVKEEKLDEIGINSTRC